MSEKLNCFECKNWFDVNELIYLPTEQYYLCHHDAATYYAMKCESLRAERDELKQRAEAAESNVRFYDGFMIGADMPDVKTLLAVVEAAQKLQDKMRHIYDTSEYKSVWAIAQAHIGSYEGENWIAEFDELAAALERVTK